MLEITHPDLALVHRAQGKYEEAEKQRRGDLEEREVSRTKHPSTLGSVYNLAYFFHNKVLETSGTV